MSRGSRGRREREKRGMRSLWTDQKVARKSEQSIQCCLSWLFLHFPHLPLSLSPLSLTSLVPLWMLFDIMLEIIYHLNNNASNYVKMPYNRYDSWEGNARGRRMIFFVADDCWKVHRLGWDGMRYACECFSTAPEELSSMASWGKPLQIYVWRISTQYDWRKYYSIL